MNDRDSLTVDATDPEMIVVNEKPPIWETLQTAGFSLEGGIIFTWENVIYNPSGTVVDSALVAHEATHCKQQAEVGGPVKWWERWLNDLEFRAEQEAQAYAEQYRHFCALHHDRNERVRYLHSIAGHLCNGTYKLTMARQDARNAIFKRAEKPWATHPTPARTEESASK